MKKAISKAILRMAGWKLGPVDGVDLPKCIVCVAPHTSNWDFIVGKLFIPRSGVTLVSLLRKSGSFSLLICCLTGWEVFRWIVVNVRR